MKYLLFFSLFVRLLFAQYSASNEWYEIRMDQIADPGNETFTPFNQDETVSITWDHIGVPDTSGTWYPLFGSTYIHQLDNLPSLWVGSTITFDIPLAAKSPGYYQVRVRTWGHKIINGVLTPWATPYTESVYPLSIRPPQAPGGTRLQ